MPSSFGFMRFAQANLPPRTPAPARRGDPPELPGLNAQQYIIVKRDTGEILYGRDIHTPKVTASNTKLVSLATMMHGGLVASPQDLKRMLTFSDNDLTMTLAAEFMATKGAKWLNEHGVQGVTDQSLKRDAVAARNILRGNPGREPSNAKVIPQELRERIDSHFTPLMNRLARELGMDHAHFTNSVGAYWHRHEPPSASPTDMAKLLHFINEKDPGLLPNSADPHQKVTTEGGREKGHTAAKYLGNRPEVQFAKTGSQWPKFYDASDVGNSLRKRYPSGSYVLSMGFKGQDGENYMAFMRVGQENARPGVANKLLDLMAERTKPAMAPAAASEPAPQAVPTSAPSGNNQPSFSSGAP